jgi:hypothetical protein
LSSERIAAAEETTLLTFAQLFRGGRLVRNTGSYQARDGRTFIEQCTVAWCETPVIGQRLEKIVQLGQTIAKVLEQESVLLTITRLDGEQHWLGPVAPMEQPRTR